ncbi:hypothetical protein OROGR_006577 [Orobanche gracilis]
MMKLSGSTWFAVVIVKFSGHEKYEATVLKIGCPG